MPNNMRSPVSRSRDRRGATAIEYTLVASLIAVGAIAGAQQLGLQFGGVSERLDVLAGGSKASAGAGASSGSSAGTGGSGSGSGGQSGNSGQAGGGNGKGGGGNGKGGGGKGGGG